MSQAMEILPVFISSTWRDLLPEREAVETAVQRLHETKYVGMEYFGSGDETTHQSSLEGVDRSRVYVGIIGARYGSGITEAEYRRARERGLPCFIYFKDDSTISDGAREMEPAKAAKLEALKEEFKRAHRVSTFKNPDDLAARVTADLHNWLFEKYLTPKLQAALNGEVPREEAQALLGAVVDLSVFSGSLVSRLQSGGFFAPAIPTLHQLRAPVGDFVGREKEIADLTAALRGGASAAITGISGMGGIGKTELAFYVANELRDAYPDAQLVLDMRGTDNPPRDPADALAACIRAFVGVEQSMPDDLQELTRIYRSSLEGRRALILLDNASDSAQTRPLLPPAGSALLITSRETIALAGLKRVTLEQLEPVEARKLLTSIAPRVTPDTADRICYLCGYLPLAIRAAGSLLDVTADLDPKSYAEQLQDERRRLERIGVEGVDHGVEASFGLSYARLTPDAASVFRRLGAFPASFDARAEETVCEDLNHKHLSQLLRRNLVRYNEETRRYGLHDLARLFADSRMSDDEGRATRMRHARYYLTVLWECNTLYKKGGDAIKSGLARFDVERRNIEAGQEWAYQHSSGDEVAARLCNEYPNAGGEILHLRQHPREYISWLEAALAVARQLKNRATEGGHSANLGTAYEDLGETQRAVEFHEQALIVLREIGDRRGEGAVLGNLGRAYDALGETRRAIEFYEQDLAIAREMGDRRGEGITIGNMGVAYRSLGETQRAVELYEQQLTIVREVGDHHVEGIALFNTGVALDELGDRAKAVTYVEAAFEIFEQIESPFAERAKAMLAQWRGEA